MSILLPRGARDRAMAGLRQFLIVTVFPRLSTATEVEKVSQHLISLRDDPRDMEATVKIESSELAGRTVITIVLDLKEGTPNAPLAS